MSFARSSYMLCLDFQVRQQFSTVYGRGFFQPFVLRESLALKRPQARYDRGHAIVEGQSQQPAGGNDDNRNDRGTDDS